MGKDETDYKGGIITSYNIEVFRNTINTEVPFVKNQLMNYEGRALWNVVCSAMDWVETASHWLNYRREPEIHNEVFCDSMNLIFYIMAIDMMYEGVSQLYRVFYGNMSGHANAELMKGSKGIFSDIKHCEDDVRYFKQIRAIYGTHSVKLGLSELFYSGKERKAHEKDRWFASWSYNLGSGLPTEVFVYSSNPNVPAIPFSIDIDEINHFAECINGWIPKITKKAKELEESRMVQLKKSEWESFGKNEYEEHIRYLLKKNYEYTDNDCYRMVLCEIDRVLKSKSTEEIVIRLKNKAISLLDKMDVAIRNVEEIEDVDWLEPKTTTIPYPASKAYTSLIVNVVENYEDSDFYYWGDSLRDYVGEVVTIEDHSAIEEQYVIITAALLEMENRL